jgi:hypothetical protein
MEQIPLSQDDLLDVTEMTRKIEGHISEVLKDNDLVLAMSALISASINCILVQCKTMEHALLYRNIFMGTFDFAIKNIQIKGPDQSTSSTSSS